MICPYCRGANVEDLRTCPSCASDLTVDPTRRGLTVLGCVLLCHAAFIALLYGWCYRPTGWLHPVLDPFVRGVESSDPAPVAGDFLVEVFFQIALPALPIALGVLLLRWEWGRTRGRERI